MIYIWAIPLLFGTFCGGMSWNGHKFWYVVVLEQLSLCINFQPPGCIRSPAIPSGRYEKCRFLSIFKNSYLSFQATNFNLATGILKVFHKVSVKNYTKTLARNPYFSQPLKRNTVRSKEDRTQKYAKNRNLKLNTFSNEDLKGFSKTFKMPIAKLHLVA